MDKVIEVTNELLAMFIDHDLRGGRGPYAKCLACLPLMLRLDATFETWAAKP